MSEYDNPTMVTESGEQVDCAAHEVSARAFAEVTHIAREMVPLMCQSFKLRIKDKGLGFSIHEARDAKYLSKWLDVKLDWDAAVRNPNLITFTLLGVDERALPINFMFTKEEFFKHVTQKGLAPKMFAVWKEYVDTLKPKS